LKIGVLALKIAVFANFVQLYCENWTSQFRLLNGIHDTPGASVDAENWS